VPAEAPALGCMAVILALTTAQLLFSIALGAVALVVVAFALHVVATTMRTRRWYRR
jgi:membrane protein implicated in regulation of membrane protease activity